MILSMTGYGKAESQLRGRKLICEIRSLNSKTMDISVRLAPQLRARELDLRTILTQRLERGKADLFITEETMDNGHWTICFLSIGRRCRRTLNSIRRR